MSVAEYCLQKTASDNETNASAETVNSSFYVDDGLISCKGLEDVKQIIAKLSQSGGFELKKFVSENPGLLSNIDSSRLLHNGQAINSSDNHLNVRC